MIKHSREVIEERLMVCEKVKYNRFQWWRNWKVRDELHPLKPTIEKIRNGDFDHSPYYWMAEYALYELEDRTTGVKDIEKKREVESLYMEKYRRLLQDYHKDENHRLTQLRQEFKKCFGIDRDTLDTIMEEFEGTLEDLYFYLSDKYTPHRQDHNQIKTSIYGEQKEDAVHFPEGEF